MRPDSTVQWSAYPALRAAATLALGVLLSAAAPGLAALWLPGMLAGAGLMVWAWHGGRRRLVSLAPLMITTAVGLLCLLAGGWLQARYQARTTPPLARHAASEPLVTLLGRLDAPPDVRPSGTRFTLAGIRLPDNPPEAPPGRLQVTLARPAFGPPTDFPPVALGDVLRVSGRLRPLPLPRNPADFDYGGYLERRGVHATMMLYEADAVAVLGRQRGWMENRVAQGRAYVQRRLERYIRGAPARSILSALLLGDRSALDGTLRERFVQTGLMHLLAVSGLHVMLVGMVLYSLLRPLLLRLGRGRLGWRAMEISRTLLTLGVLGYYVLLTGAAVPVTRAFVMTGVLLGQVLLQRTTHTLNALGVAALVLLVAAPMQLFEPGFQLSFAAVIAIVVLNPRFTALVPEAWQTRPWARGILSSFTVSLAATLGTLPVLLYHFGFVSFAGLVLNLAAIPLTAASMATTMLMLLAPDPLAAVFGQAASGCVLFLIGLVETGEAVLGWASVRAYVDNLWILLSMTAALVMMAQWPRPRYRWRLAGVSLAFAVVALWLHLLTPLFQPRLDVLFFDVGQGDAALIRLPNDRHLLIDAGVRNAYTDQGTRTLLPHLERFGIRHLDAVVITHPHSDHLGGLPALLRAVSVGRVVHNGGAYPSALYEETNRLLDSLAVPHAAVRAGDTLALAPTVRLRILAPDAAPTHPDDANEGSVVVHLTYGTTRLLFMGDAGAETEARLIARYDTLFRSEVVKVGHHGSATSSSLAFLTHVLADPPTPSLAVISAGRNNVFGHPRPEVVERWQAHGATLWNTAEQGALWLRSDGTRLKRIAWR